MSFVFRLLSFTLCPSSFILHPSPLAPRARPGFETLIDTAHRQNLNLRMAGVRVLQSRAELGLAIGELYPQDQLVSGSVSYNRIPGSIP